MTEHQDQIIRRELGLKDGEVVHPFSRRCYEKIGEFDTSDIDYAERGVNKDFFGKYLKPQSLS